MTATSSTEVVVEDWICALILLTSFVVVLLVSVDFSKVAPFLSSPPACESHCR